MTAEFVLSRLPIIQAPMGGSRGVELCVAVCEAGGFGSLPTAMLMPSELRDQIAEGARSAKRPASHSWRVKPISRRRPQQLCNLLALALSQ
jgi:NAD(P)H-dependent flavin oxidoreductase YrpB (nitropropane dioxygenase family)